MIIANIDFNSAFGYWGFNMVENGTARANFNKDSRYSRRYQPYSRQLKVLHTLVREYETNAYCWTAVLHSGWMTKKRERTGPSPKGIISYWKRHFFVFLASGDLLYFPDETMSMLQGRVDVRNASTVRVSGEIHDRHDSDKHRKYDDCLVWIATPPSKLFILKVIDSEQKDLNEARYVGALRKCSSFNSV